MTQVSSIAKRQFLVASIVGLLLLIPLIAMQFSAEVNWSFFDFVVATFLLLSAGLAIEFSLRKLKNSAIRLTVALGIVFLLILIWAELAVGIFGSPIAGN